MYTICKSSVFVLVYVFCVTVAANEDHGPTVMGIDFRAETMKLSLMRDNKLVEIVYYKGIKKEIPVAVAFRDNERVFGEDALAFGIRNPKFCYIYLLDLIGKTMDNPMIRLFQKRFPQYDIVEDSIRHSILFKHDEVTFYSPEELLAMVLMDAKDYIKRTTNLDMKEIVITVPAYFNQAERKALISVCSLAGLKVNQLMTQNAAVVLDYARRRVEEFHENPRYFMFYDMDAYSTVATIVRFQLKKQENREQLVPRVTVIGIGFDRILGGLEMQFRLRDYLAEKFNEKNLSSTNAFNDYRILSILFAEAGIIRNTLNVNEESQCNIHNLIESDNINFTQNVTRAEFENLCEDMRNRIISPMQRALEVSQLSFSLIEQVFLINHSTQIPFIKRVLRETFSVEDRKFMNVETAVAAAGAAYEAALKTPNFIQGDILFEDAILFPIKISALENDSDETFKNETVFKLMESYPLHKELIFKDQDKFSFNLFYGDLNFYSEDDIKNLGEPFLEMVTAYRSSKVDSNNGISSEIKVHFVYDLNGIVSVTKIVRIIDKSLKNLDYSEKMLHIPPLNGKQFHESLVKINNLRNEDIRRKHQEKSLDMLLTAIINTRENLQKEDFISFAKETELMNIEKKCNELTDWLQKSNEGWTGDYHILDEKFVQLHDIVKPVFERRTRYLTKIERLAILEKDLQDDLQFLQLMEHVSKSGSESQSKLFSGEDIERFRKLVKEEKDFLENVKKEEVSLPKSGNFSYQVEDVVQKTDVLDQQLKDLIRKRMQHYEHRSTNGKHLDSMDITSEHSADDNIESGAVNEEMPEDYETVVRRISYWMCLITVIVLILRFIIKNVCGGDNEPLIAPCVLPQRTTKPKAFSQISDVAEHLRY